MKVSKLFPLLYFIFLSIIGFSQQTIHYTSSSEIIANPERGLQKYSITNSSYSTTNNYSNLSLNGLKNWRTSADKITVIFRYFLLEDFLNTDINQTYLNNIQRDFDLIQEAGLKCIVRFSYSNAQSTAPQQPTLNQILRHLNQLAPLLEANKHIILFHQAGFLGTWGEWYYTNSTEFGTDGNINTQQWANRKQIVEAMLTATPSNIPIQVRYVGIKQTMYGLTPLTAETAYQNTPNARIGFFNDAFLNNWGDQGTYRVNGANVSPVGTADYTYLSNETKYLPMSGETNGENAPRTNASNAILELDATHWTTLNRDYHTTVWNNWIADGKYNDIVKNLGYRFTFQLSTFSQDGNTLQLHITLNNSGYARLLKERKVYLVLENTLNNDTVSFLLNTDPRTWENATSINQTLELSNLAIGAYNAYLFLPDLNSNLKVLPEYSIRFANENTWIAATGMNDLNQKVNVTTVNSTQHFIKNQLSLFPNPTSEELFFSNKVDYELFNELGTLLYKGKSNMLDMGMLPSGVYIIKTGNEIHQIVKE